MDPRVKTPLSGLEQAFRMEVRLASLMDSGTTAIGQARALNEDLERLSKQTSGSLAEQVTALQKKMAAILGASDETSAVAPPEPSLSRLAGEFSTFYEQVGRADAMPTASQVTALAAIERDSSLVMKRWEEAKTSDLLRLNSDLHAAGLPELRLQDKPLPQTESENEE